MSYSSVQVAKACQDIYGVEARLFVGNIPNDFPPEQVLYLLYTCFQDFGTELSVLMEFRKGYRVAWVQYTCRTHAQCAMDCANGPWGLFLLSRQLRVEWAKGRWCGNGYI